MRVATVFLFVLALASQGCTHHEDHHARGEEHWHHAPDVGNVHGIDDEHHQDSDPDTFHGH